MTVANNYAPVVQAANGVTTIFSGPWNALAAANIFVQLLNTTTGIYTTISQGAGSTQYQVSTVTAAGFAIAFNTAPAIGNNVVISRNTPQAQTIPYTTSRGFQGPIEEGSFDALTAMLQENQDAGNRSLKFPVGDTTSSTLPSPTARALQFLGFDASGSPIAGIPAGGGALVSAAMQPVVSATTLALARAAMGAAASGANSDITSVGAISGVTATAGDNTTKLATTAFVLANGGGIKVIRRQVFTASGTYTPNAFLIYADVEGWGPGGGGGGVTTTAGNVGAGGGAGGYFKKLLSLATIGASQTITIPAGGTGGTNAGGTGTTSTATTVGALLTANPGTGGVGSAASTPLVGGIGGTATGGDINITGSSANVIGGNAAQGEVSGAGASTSLGGGGISQNYLANAAGSNALANTGSGGGGAAANGTANVGGNGAAGRVIATEFCSQ